jgi:TPP-dependent pyruvate/acetoin dehydrogenase alpha subunit
MAENASLLASPADQPEAEFTVSTDWEEVARLVLTSRELDRLEEEELVPAKQVLYQFSARGHDMAQVLLGLHLKDGDAACGYYPLAPLAAGPRRAAGRCARLGHGSLRRLFWRA